MNVKRTTDEVRCLLFEASARSNSRPTNIDEDEIGYVYMNLKRWAMR